MVVSKLLDVPVETGIFGAGAKTYFLRVLDHKSSELVSSDDIQGISTSTFDCRVALKVS